MANPPVTLRIQPVTLANPADTPAISPDKRVNPADTHPMTAVTMAIHPCTRAITRDTVPRSADTLSKSAETTPRSAETMPRSADTMSNRPKTAAKQVHPSPGANDEHLISSGARRTAPGLKDAQPGTVPDPRVHRRISLHSRGIETIMQRKHSITLTTLQNVQAFMDAYATQLGGLNASAARTSLDALEQQLSAQAVTQAQGKSGSKAEQARQRVLRNTIRAKYLDQIASIAATQLSQVPDFAALKIPRGTNTTQKLVAVALSMANAASKYAQTFIDQGMARTFVADLKTAVDGLKASQTSKGSTLSKQVGATSSMKLLTSQARKLVHQLDTQIGPKLAAAPALLAQWKAVKRFAGKTAAISVATIDSAATTSPPASTSTSNSAATPSGLSSPAPVSATGQSGTTSSSV